MLEGGGSFIFQVQFQPGAGFNKTEPGKTSQPGVSEPGKAGQPGQTERENKENQENRDKERSTSTAGQPGETAGAPSMGPKTANFRFTVQDTKDKETTLILDLGCVSGAEGDRSTSAQGMDEMLKSVGTLTVKVDENGNVKDIQGWDGLNWSVIESHGSAEQGQPREAGKEGQPGQPRETVREGQAHHQQWMRKVIDADLELIFGASSPTSTSTSWAPRRPASPRPRRRADPA